MLLMKSPEANKEKKNLNQAKLYFCTCIQREEVNEPHNVISCVFYFPSTFYITQFVCAKF